MESHNIVIIGPAGVGKSTTARSLAERMGRRYVSLDRERFRFYEEIGYDRSYADELRKTDFEELLRYYEPFNAHAVARAMQEFQSVVLDFGAIHSVYDDPDLFSQVRHVLLPCPFVFLLLPCSDICACIDFLIDRGRAGAQLDLATEQMWRRVIRRFLERPDNGLLAKRTIYVQGKSSGDVTDEILSCMGSAH